MGLGVCVCATEWLSERVRVFDALWDEYWFDLLEIEYNTIFSSFLLVFFVINPTYSWTACHDTVEQCRRRSWFCCVWLHWVSWELLTSVHISNRNLGRTITTTSTTTKKKHTTITTKKQRNQHEQQQQQQQIIQPRAINETPTPNLLGMTF